MNNEGKIEIKKDSNVYLLRTLYLRVLKFKGGFDSG
jgi:hypothetical protein